jgi:cell fate (sporulation/competence/biofilm development) regulator YlbF (YheA/YmcA/DUF963 family)
VQKSTQSILKYGFSETQAVAIAKNGIKEFRKIRDKVMPKIENGSMPMADFVPYVVSIYQKKGVLVKQKENE